MSLRFLLDTNVLSEPISKRPGKKLMGLLQQHGAESATAAPVIHELRYGSRMLEPSRRRIEIERYIDQVVLRVYSVLAYDQLAAEYHADERARLAKLGRTPPLVDAIIASIARVNALVLVTANVKDFQIFKGLSVENWSG